MALKSYFCSKHEHENQFQQQNVAFNDPISEIYLMFFHSAIATFSNFNLFLQREDPLIYLMHAQMEAFMTKLAVKFVQPEKVREHKQRFGSLKSVDISIENQKADEALSIGMISKGKLRKLLEEGDNPIHHVDKYDGVRKFYSMCICILHRMAATDFQQRTDCSMDTVEEVLSSLENIQRDLIKKMHACD